MKAFIIWTMLQGHIWVEGPMPPHEAHNKCWTTLFASSTPDLCEIRLIGKPQ